MAGLIYRINGGGARIVMASRRIGKLYAMDGAGDYRELSNGEATRRAAEEAAFAERKALESSQPPPLTMEQRMARMEADMLLVKDRLGIP